MRTIPTRVGRTSLKCSRFRLQADHPHACGENVAVVMMEGMLIGPSPRVWGEHLTCLIPPWRCRTIPTRVGRTPAKSQRRNEKTDHPHACGENPGLSTGYSARSKFFRESERLIFLIHPLFGHQPQAAKVSV